jgi:propanol-preferring alcohol dehydrogenase
MGYKVIGIDVSEDSIRLAKEANIDHVFNSRTQPDYKEQIRKITNGGVDGVSVFTAVQAGYVGATDLLRIGGTLSCVGCPPNADLPGINLLDLTLTKYNIVGANNRIMTPEDLYECVEFTHKHNIVASSKYFELEQIAEMVENVESNVYAGTRMAVKFT